MPETVPYHCDVLSFLVSRYSRWLKITFITFIFLTHPFFHFSCYPPLSCSTTEKYNLQMNSSYHFLCFLVVFVLEGKYIASTKPG